MVSTSLTMPVWLAALLVGEVDRDIHFEPASPRALGEILDRRLRAEVIERGGTKVGDERAERADLALELADRLADRLDDRLRFGAMELGGEP